MDTNYYWEIFQSARESLDKSTLAKKKMESRVVFYGKDCIVLKLFKNTWANPFEDPLTSESRIFFSVWVSESSLKEQKLLYNIHALKLRQLKNYSIQSRKFAETFRDRIGDYVSKWENLRLDFGPQTLMEGWMNLDPENIQDTIILLSNHFLDMAHVMDETLNQFKKA